MRRIPLVPAVILAVVLILPLPVRAAEKIAAVVNDEVISYYDLDARLSLVMAGANVPDTAENRRRLAPQILRRLIDESIQMQEAKRLKIRVDDADLEQAFAQIEKQNNLAPGQLDAFLRSKGVDKSALTPQVEAEIAWAKLVGRVLRPQVQITKEDIDDALARMKAAEGQPERLLAEIFLPVDSPEREAEVNQLARRIMQQLEQGATFSALARNFSRSATAAQGGDLGWVRQGELDDEIDKVVEKMTPGTIAGPVRTIGGYHIIMLRDKRIARGLAGANVSVDLQQLVFPLPGNATAADVEAAAARARSAAAQATSCSAMEKIAAELGTPLSGSLGTVKLASLPSNLRDAVSALDIGQPSAPVRTGSGIVVLMVCGREGESSQEDVRQQVEHMLFAQRMEIAAQRYMRDLRRAAFIDVRL